MGAFEHGAWLPIEEFVQNMEESQLVHLRRARDETSIRQVSSLPPELLSHSCSIGGAVSNTSSRMSSYCTNGEPPGGMPLGAGRATAAVPQATLAAPNAGALS